MQKKINLGGKNINPANKEDTETKFDIKRPFNQYAHAWSENNLFVDILP
ncbi:MAG: hypothetical protein HN884_06555 [Rhodospirillaceae bacterium]|jgi:hypothetical protein|nr:hypothetical protein [Rhodospirillaceae bacterium]